MLNFNEALSGLDFIANGEFKTDDPAEQRAYALRLIERLLDQLDVKAREATPSEDTYLRRAIALCADGEYKEAVGYAFRAAGVGHKPIFGGIESSDQTLSLRDALSQARG